MTSSTVSGAIPARDTAARIAAAPRSEVGVSLNDPANLPIAVRAAPAITTRPPITSPWKTPRTYPIPSSFTRTRLGRSPAVLRLASYHGAAVVLIARLSHIRCGQTGPGGP